MHTLWSQLVQFDHFISQSYKLENDDILWQPNTLVPRSQCVSHVRDVFEQLVHLKKIDKTIEVEINLYKILNSIQKNQTLYKIVMGNDYRFNDVCNKQAFDVVQLMIEESNLESMKGEIMQRLKKNDRNAYYQKLADQLNRA